MAEALSRKNFLRLSAAAAGALAAAPAAGAAHATTGTGGTVADPDRAWDAAAAILRRVRPPSFPDRVVDITDHGAVDDGTTDCTAAIRSAVEACHAAGGGRVLVPAGTFRTGAVHLLSDIELHLAAGATLAFSRDPQDYLPVVYTRYEGIELMNYSPLVYAYRQRNVAITGDGVLFGRADDEHWWDWTTDPAPVESPDKALLAQMAADGVPVADRVFGDGHYLRPNMVQFYECENVLLDGITVRDSPMWNIHPVLCRNVMVRSVTVDSPHGPNNDGIDAESCTDVVIRDCSINTGDDCVALKAGKDEDGRRVGAPCQNVVVTDCEMADGNGGVTIGSETSGGVRDVFVQRCRMSSPHLERAIRIKSNPDRGGVIERLHVRNVEVGEAADSVVEMVMNYANVVTGDHHPVLRDVTISHLTAQKAPMALNLRGNDGHPLRDIRLHACRFDGIAGPDQIQYVDGLVLDQVWVNGVRVDK